MLVTFRVKDIETRLNSKPAQIRPPELAELMRRLHTTNSTIDADPGEFLAAPLNFEINANALAIAEFASCFDHGLKPPVNQALSTSTIVLKK